MGVVGSGIGKLIVLPILLLNTIFAVIILGLTAHFLDKIIAGKYHPTAPGVNGAALFFVLLALIASAVSIASYISGFHHLRLWRSESGSAAQGTAWIAWFFLILAFVLAWKEIHIGHRPVKVRVAEAFVIILTVTHFIYTLLIHLGRKDSDHTTTSGPHHKPGNPNAPVAASAV